jgi:signal transduction histidine kinase
MLEKEKIFRHLQTMEEGVAIFSSDRRLILSNRSFLHYASIMADFELGSPEDIFRVGAVTSLLERTADGEDEENVDERKGSSSGEVTMMVHNRYINIRCNLFKDNTFEIVIKDITRSEKNRVLKQQLTSNIAHELRTPLTAILGYLETLLSSEDIDPVTQRQFLGRTRDQADRLAELLDHIAVLNKLEEGAGFYGLELISVRTIVEEVTDSLRIRINDNGAMVDIDIPENVVVRGNPVLLNSIFQNLFDNTLNYAGENVFISLSMYFEDASFYHFRYSNDGRSVDERHLSRLFERFYRVDKGRSRKMGGSGLGLAIVKHAVQFHRGDITAKNRPGGGLEFLFSLAKNIE